MVETAVGGLAMGATGVGLGLMGVVWLRTIRPVCWVWNPLERAADAVGLSPLVARAWGAGGRLLRAAVGLLPERGLRLPWRRA